MAKKTQLVKFANGEIKRLTTGEINAIRAYVKMNGKDGSGPERIQYEPGYVKYTTINNLIAKGVFEYVTNGCVRFADGVLDLTIPA
jgi:hypothetical protein